MRSILVIPTFTLLLLAARVGQAEQFVVYSDAKDIWTTSVYAYAPGGTGPGGGENSEFLRIGGWGDIYLSLLEFDLSSLPGNALSATLRLYSISDSGNPTGFYLDRITESWDWRTEGTGRDRDRLWWADRPDATQWAPSAYPAPTRDAWNEIDITPLYNAWKDGSIPNHGLQLRPASNSSNNFERFYSSDYTENPALRPHLVITPTPEPSSLMLLLSGALCFNFRRGRGV